jgi:hypothetical protein
MKFIFIHSQYSIQREIFVCRFRILRDHLFLLNHQLTPETLQIQDCYSLIRFLHLFQIYVAIFTYVPFLSYESTSLMTDKYMSLKLPRLKLTFWKIKQKNILAPIRFRRKYILIKRKCKSQLYRWRKPVYSEFESVVSSGYSGFLRQ